MGPRSELIISSKRGQVEDPWVRMGAVLVGRAGALDASHWGPSDPDWVVWSTGLLVLPSHFLCQVLACHPTAPQLTVHLLLDTVSAKDASRPGWSHGSAAG